MIRAPVSRRLAIAFLSTVLVLLVPEVAWAHEGGAAAGLFNGLRHPVSGLDHVVAMVAVGLWGAQLGAPALWLLPITFPVVMALGGMLGLIGVPIPGVEVGIAASAIVLGAMVLGEVRAPLLVTAIIVSFFAIFHGHAHGAELPEGQSGITYSLGFVISTGLLHAVGIAIGLVHRWPEGRRALRFAGGGVVVVGCIFLWRAIS